MQSMSHMMNIFPSVARVHPNDFGIRCSLELLRSRGSDEALRRRYEARDINEVAQGRDLSDGLDGTFSKDGEES